jgi:sarcosine oxidase subunit alpha
VALANNDRPGVMLSGAVRTYLNRYAVAPGRTVVVFGASDEAHRTAADLLRAGVHVAGLVDARDTICDLDVPFYPNALVERVLGRDMEAAVIRRADGSNLPLQADLLAMSGGWNPNVHLSCHLNGRPIWREDIAAFVPAPGAIPGMIPAGACNGTVTTAACLAEGQEAAQEVLGLTGPLPDLPEAEDSDPKAQPIWVVPGKGENGWISRTTSPPRISNRPHRKISGRSSI